MLGPRPEELVKEISIPMLVLWGDKDPWTPVDGKVWGITPPKQH